jgi:hypothetical protein
MKLGLEERVLEQKLRFYLMVNGILAISVFASAAYVLYKILKAIIE